MTTTDKLAAMLALGLMAIGMIYARVSRPEPPPWWIEEHEAATPAFVDHPDALSVCRDIIGRGAKVVYLRPGDDGRAVCSADASQ